MTRKQLLIRALLLAAFLLTNGAVASTDARASKEVVTTLMLDELNEETKPEHVRELVSAVKAVKGVKRARAVKAKGLLVVRHRPSVRLEAIEKAVVEAGFAVEDYGHRPDNEDF